MPLWQLTPAVCQKTHRVPSTTYLRCSILLRPLAQTARIEPDTTVLDPFFFLCVFRVGSAVG